MPIPLGVRPPRPVEPVALDTSALEPFVLYVGAAERRKGFDTLLSAMQLVARERPDLSLVATTRLLGEFEVPPGVRVIELGHVDDRRRSPRSIAPARCSPFPRATRALDYRCSRR